MAKAVEHTGPTLYHAPAESLPLVEELRFIEPVVAARQFADWPNLLVLHSGDADSRHARYSYITADPAEWHDGGQWDPFSGPQATLTRFAETALTGLPPFQGGWAGFWSYDLNERLEKIGRPPPAKFASPPFGLGLYDWVMAFDMAERRCWLIATGRPEAVALRRRQRAAERIESAKRRLASPIPKLPTSGPIETRPAFGHATPWTGVTCDFSRREYVEAVRRVIRYIEAGDCFQVNLSQRFNSPCGDSWRLFERLCAVNPAPFSGYLSLGASAIVSASPERFIRVHDRWADTFPIKGTRPRGVNPEDDRRLVDDLVSNPKDRAENVMIVDLMRNDLGRSCRPGSVRVGDVCRLESFASVHHLVSEVRGELKWGRSSLDMLKNAFPGGSVTGAPKVRAMQIIAELERSARGAYCGSMGFVSFNGDMDTNILIRTAAVGGGHAWFSAGGGIVADSDPELEYDETLHKARRLAEAVTECRP